METQTRPCGQKDAKGCVVEQGKVWCGYPGLRSAVGKLMRNGLVEAWKENTEGKVWSGEELGDCRLFLLKKIASDAY